MPPQIPADLTTLSIEELTNLINELVAYASANASGDPTDEAIAAMTAVRDGHSRVAAELASREAPAPEAVAEVAATATLAELAAGVVPVAAPTAPAPEAGEAASGETPPEGTPETIQAGGFSLEQITAAVAAGVRAAQPESVPVTAELVAAGEPLQMPALASLRPSGVTVVNEPTPIRPVETITAAADVPGFSMGTELPSLMDVGRAIIARRENIGDVPVGSPSEKITVARVHSNMPEERTLRSGQAQLNTQKIEAVTGREALVAAGGPCVPVQPYYGLLVQAGAHRPVRDMLQSFTADRGGISTLAPPTISSPGTETRSVADGATNTNTTVTSATAAFTARDVGAAISGTGIPAGAYIVSVTNATTVIISVAATATATGVTITIVRRGAVGVVTSAQDLAALNGTDAQIVAGTKPCLHVACPAPTTVQLAAISWCLEFGNFTTRAFPEQMPAWLQLTLAVWARTAETRLLDRMSALSTQITAASVVGASRTLIAQIVKASAYFRNRNRLDDDVTLRVALPRWVLDLAVCDLVLGSGYDARFLSQARETFRSGLAEANVVPSFYVDSGTGKGQLFAPGGTAGAIHGAGALVAFPSTVVWYMFPEGSFLFLDGGTLDFGLWRDSSLNSLNNYRLMAESFEELAGVGYEMLEVTSTVAANGTFAGPAYGSTTVGAPVAIPSSF